MNFGTIKLFNEKHKMGAFVEGDMNGDYIQTGIYYYKFGYNNIYDSYSIIIKFRKYDMKHYEYIKKNFEV